MKKLDLHIHTKSTKSESSFSFSREKLRDYVSTLDIDGIAITNHNIFDLEQYIEINDYLSDICTVLPGIEINVGIRKMGHLLCIANQDDVEDFAVKCRKVAEEIKEPTDFLEIDMLKQIFGDLGKYLWIPHYDKKPSVDERIIEEMGKNIQCGEVSSVKKFVYCQQREDTLVPVLFSDLRPTGDVEHFLTRQTFFEIENITISEIKKSLINRNHVSLTKEEGHDLFYALPELPISTGLTVVLGQRSSGKTYTLDRIKERNENVKYIKQFSLIEIDPEKEAQEFEDNLSKKRGSFVEGYFSEFKDAVDIAKEVSPVTEEKMLEQYINSLVTHAKEYERADEFSKCALYNESKFAERSFTNITTLIDSVRKLLDSREYRTFIEKRLSRESLLLLLEDLIEEYKEKKRQELKEKWVNGLVEKMKISLSIRTASHNVPDFDFYNFKMDCAKVDRFNKLVEVVKKESEINREEAEEFVIQITKKPFLGAAELKKVSGSRSAVFSNSLDSYNNNPHQFLLDLKEMSEIPETEYYKYFANVEYKILNKYGFTISGGERAEFKLIQEIKKANDYDILMIDEPESSFDNIFLNDHVNNIIRNISKNMPVILVTHNSTIGASIKPDYIIYTERSVGDSVTYERYCGLPSSKELLSKTGKTIKNFRAMLDCLEAGEKVYYERKSDYEILKD